MQIIPCSRAQLDGTLQQALEADCPAWQAVRPLSPRRSLWAWASGSAHLIQRPVHNHHV